MCVNGEGFEICALLYLMIAKVRFSMSCIAQITAETNFFMFSNHLGSQYLILLCSWAKMSQIRGLTVELHFLIINSVFCITFLLCNQSKTFSCFLKSTDTNVDFMDFSYELCHGLKGKCCRNVLCMWNFKSPKVGSFSLLSIFLY